MTTFHDQPPRSRREARESERALATQPGMDYTQFLTPEQEEAARAARRAAAPAPGSRRALRENGVPDEETEAPRFRYRDYSPDGSASGAPATPPALVEPPAGAPISLDYHATPIAPSGRPALTRRELRALEAAQHRSAAGTEPEVEPTAAPSTLSNAIAEFEALARAKQERDVAGAAQREAAVLEPHETETDSAESEFEHPDADTGAGPDASQRVVDLPPPPGFGEAIALPSFGAPPAPTAERTAWPFGVTQTQPPVIPPFDEDEDAVDASDQASVVTEADPEPGVFDEPEAAPVAELPDWIKPTQAFDPFAFAPPASDSQIIDARVSEETVAEDSAETDDLTADFVEPPVVRESYTPPAGHWSRQAELEDDDLPYENTLSREVGAGHSTTTTSALILPSIPQSDFASLINATGEILVTGTIDLPAGLSTMGVDARHIDDPNVDHMFDAFDKELVSNDSQPVRAIRAVSTHTQTSGIVAVSSKPPSNRLFRVAAIAACVLAVAVVGFLGVYVVHIL